MLTVLNFGCGERTVDFGCLRGLAARSCCGQSPASCPEHKPLLEPVQPLDLGAVLAAAAAAAAHMLKHCSRGDGRGVPPRCVDVPVQARPPAPCPARLAAPVATARRRHPPRQPPAPVRAAAATPAPTPRSAHAALSAPPAPAHLRRLHPRRPQPAPARPTPPAPPMLSPGRRRLLPAADANGAAVSLWIVPIHRRVAAAGHRAVTCSSAC